MSTATTCRPPPAAPRPGKQEMLLRVAGRRRRRYRQPKHSPAGCALLLIGCALLLVLATVAGFMT
jgi:hypothetical protein